MDPSPPRGRSPYETLLGQEFASLHTNVRRAHLAPLRAEGEIDVEHGLVLASGVLLSGVRDLIASVRPVAA